MTLLWRSVALATCLLTLVPAAAASADDYFAGEAKGQPHSWILIHRADKHLSQVLLHVKSRCTIDGKKADPSFGYDELKQVDVKDKRFRADRRYAAPTTGLEQPKYKWRYYLRGRIFSDSLKLKFRTKYIDNHRKQKLRCLSGPQRSKLQEISKAEYLELVSETPFEPR